MSDKLNEEAMALYAASIEGNGNTIEMPENAVKGRGKRDESAIGSAEDANALRQQARQQQSEYNAKTLEELHEEKARRVRQEAIDSGTALAPIEMEDLPSRGMFYPEGTRMWINAARLADIKRWTSMDETDVQNINDKIIDILQSCCKISFGPDVPKHASYKDLIEIDRLYLLFAIHDYTFKPGTNDIQIKLDEKSNVILKKENITYINLSEKLLKFYDAERRCFRFPVRNTAAFSKTDGMMEIYMPKIGVSTWLRDYVRTQENRHENYDRDMAIYANLLISDWRGLTKDSYYDLIEQTRDWGIYEWSLISKIKDILIDASQVPHMKYIDGGGVERETEITFRDGIKAIFQQSLDIDL